MNRTMPTAGRLIASTHSIGRVLRRFGLVGLAFFLGKGLLWLIVPVLLASLASH